MIGGISLIKSFLPPLIKRARTEEVKRKILSLIAERKESLKEDDAEDVICVIRSSKDELFVKLVAQNRLTNEERLIEVYNYDELIEKIGGLL